MLIPLSKAAKKWRVLVPEFKNILTPLVPHFLLHCNSCCGTEFSKVKQQPLGPLKVKYQLPTPVNPTDKPILSSVSQHSSVCTLEPLLGFLARLLVYSWHITRWRNWNSCLFIPSSSSSSVSWIVVAVAAQLHKKMGSEGCPRKAYPWRAPADA